MRGNAVEYTNGTKGTWRYWAWARLRERLTIQPGLATVLFLSGPTPEDLSAATKNGFKIRNIVAVDKDEAAVKKAREAGCVAIQGDIHDVVEFWNDGEIHGVIADYCCGLSWEQFRDSSHMHLRVNGPICLNFQRGRESSPMTVLVRPLFERYGISTSRAEQYLFLMALRLSHAKHYEEHKGLITEQDMVDDFFCLDKCDVDLWMKKIQQALSPATMSYRSNVVIMDSMVLSKMWGAKIKYDGNWSRRNHAFMGRLRALCKLRGDTGSKSGRKRFEEEDKTIRKLNAMKAVRTMNGSLRIGDN